MTKIRMVKQWDGSVRVLDGSRELALITVGRGKIQIVSDQLLGDGTAAGPFTRSVKMGPVGKRPAVTIRFAKAARRD